MLGIFCSGKRPAHGDQLIHPAVGDTEEQAVFDREIGTVLDQFGSAAFDERDRVAVD